MNMEENDWFKPLGFFETFQRAFAVYRHGFATFMKISLTILVPMAVVRLVFSHMMGPVLADVDFNDPMWITNKNIWIPFAIIMVVENTGAMIMGGAYPRVVGSIYVRQEPDWSGSLKLGLKRLCTMLLAFVVYMIGVMIGCLLLYIPGVIVLVSGFMFKEAVMIENASAMSSLGRSFALTKGKRCFSLGILAVMIIAIFAINVVVFGGLNAKQTFTASGIVIQTILSIFISPLSGGIVTVMYLSFRVQDEGLTKSQLETEMSKGRTELVPQMNKNTPLFLF